MPMRYSTMRETREETGPRVTWRSVRSRAPTGRTCASMQRQASSFRPGQPHAHGHRAHLRPDRWRWGLRRCLSTVQDGTRFRQNQYTRAHGRSIYLASTSRCRLALALRARWSADHPVRIVYIKKNMCSYQRMVQIRSK